MLHVLRLPPKQASLFLRRVGLQFQSCRAGRFIVLDYLRLARGLSLSRVSLGPPLAVQGKFESTFQEIAAEFGHSMGWRRFGNNGLTMRVEKREAFL